MKDTILNRRNILFTGLVTGSFVLAILIPVRPLLRMFLDETAVLELSYAFVSVLVVIAGWFAARRLNILDTGGFREHNRRGYSWLIVPLLFPGLYMVQNVRSCSDQLFTASWLMSSGVFLLRGLMEEVLCRGVLQGYLEKNNPQISRMRITIFSATVFALLHLVALRNNHVLVVLNQVLYAFFMGLLFGALLYRTRNVWLLGIMHGILNIASKSCSALPDEEDYVSAGEYFLGLGGFLVMFSPVLLFAWLMIRTYKPPAKSV